MLHRAAALVGRLAGVGVAAVICAAAAPSFVGSAACKTCHADIWAGFFRNPHYKSIAAGNARPDKTGCEGCHGPGGDHIDAKGDKRKIVAYSQLEPAQVIGSCLACHSNTIGRAQIRRSAHTLAQVACNNCHGIHKPATMKHLLAKNQPELCGSCHPNVRAQFSLPFKHRVNEGFMTCADCHNPHGAAAPNWTMGARPRMLDAALAGEEPCLKCHADKRGPFAFEHSAVRVEGCGSCHLPHGSMNARLLKRPATFTLCLECHSGAGAFGRQGDGVKLQSTSHNMSEPRYRNCTTCHVRIHGSNADPRFLR
jgi:DmsE family decaheme c-type cytochrome